jgi:hypothetical protein
MVMGCLGLLAVQSVSLWRHTPHATKTMVMGVGGGVLLFVLLGLSPDSDILAHGGGFVTGLALGVFLSLLPGLAQRGALNLLCALGFLLLTLLPWWLAERHPH